MPFFGGDAFDWFKAVCEKAQAEPTECVWCGLPLITPDEKRWQLCTYCQIGEHGDEERNAQAADE